MPAIVVTSRANPRVKQLRAAFAGNARLSGGLVAIEGEHLLQEALRSGLPIKTIFLSERIDPPAWLPRTVELLYLADEAFYPRRGDALRVLRIDGAGEGLVGEVEEFEAARSMRGGSMRSLRKMESHEAAAQRFLEQMLAFDRDQAAGEPGRCRQRRNCLTRGLARLVAHGPLRA